MNNKNKLLEKVFIKGNIKLLSPMLIGNGIDENTSNDFLRNGEDEIFIPGTSMAGSVRDYLNNYYRNDNYKLKLLNDFLGSEEKQDGCQSIIYFYDSYIKKSGQMSIRDGIQIEEFTKVTKHNHKYNYEVAERDNIFYFRLEIIFREFNKKYIKDFYEFIKVILFGFENGNIRLGSKTNRGLGKIKIEDIECLKFNFDNPENLTEMLQFSWENEFKNIYPNAFKEGKKLIDIKDVNREQYLTEIEIPIKVRDTLFIRNYLKSDEVCAEQLVFRRENSKDERSIIPGTTLAGAFRHKVFLILYDLLQNEEKAYNKVKSLFGDKNDDSGNSSRIIFDELIDKKQSKMQTLTRNKIDRFTSGACNRGLFDKRVAIGGEFTLRILIKYIQDEDIGLILIAIYDLLNGILAIGGDTSVGRGIFMANNSRDEEKIKINGQALTNKKEEEYMKLLGMYINSNM